jgi:hypothetical protein
MLAQHTAVLGKTGAGKTITAKLMIEQVAAEGARVCILDPIKSDWWGLTSSADGKRAGLPFQILGGPHGHVPLHSSSGKAVAEIVATGALPLSIIDMAEFEPGGQARFFTEFAPALLRKMRGVVYLVIEEAHLFAPKERSGIGSENLSIHWAKTIATAGRSKGIRLILATQRTQALHNALLGSCDTLIAHRLTAPADQEPVVKWLKANTSKEILAEVSSSLASLKTGEGWICSGEARQFERVAFPKITTYDNTATPTGDGEAREIKTSPVDREKLRAIIGDAVAEAEAQDPKLLRARIAELERQAKKSASVQPAAAAPTKVEVKIVEKPVFRDSDFSAIERLLDRVVQERGAVDQRWGNIEHALTALLTVANTIALMPEPVMSRELARAMPPPAMTSRAPLAVIGTPHVARAVASHVAGDGVISPTQQRILDTLLMLETRRLEPSRDRLARWMNLHPTGGRYGSDLGWLRANSYLEGLKLADLARQVAHMMPTGPDAALLALPDEPMRAIVRVLMEQSLAVSRDELAALLQLHPTGGRYGSNLGWLRTLGLLPERGPMSLTPAFFA